MLSCLDKVRTGLLRPQTFQKAEITRRTLNFQLSSTTVVEPVFSASVLSLDIDPTGRYLLSGCGDGSWYIHDTFNLTGSIDHDKKCVIQCPRRVGHKKAVGTAQWYPVNNGLFVTSSFDGNLCIWDANNASKPVDVYDLEDVITRHQINPCCGTLIAASADGDVHLIDLRSGTAVQKLPSTMTNSKEVAWNPSNQYQLMVGSDEGHLIEWDIRSTLTYRGYGLLEVKVARRGVRTRDFREQVSLLQKAHRTAISSIQYRKDGMEFYTFGDDGLIRRWMSDTSPPTEPLVCTLKYGKKSKGHGNFQIGLSADTDPPLVFAPKGTAITVCDMKTCKIQKQLIGHFKNVNCFVYDQNYQYGYSGGNDSAIMVWSGHLVTENTYKQEKAEKDKAPTSTRRSKTNANRQLISLIDEDEYEEYDVAHSSDSS